MGILPPTQLISAREQEQDVDGVRFVFYTPGPKPSAEMTLWPSGAKSLWRRWKLLPQTLRTLHPARRQSV